MNQESIARLAFFGRMNAHISHEIKNVFATISETSGLLIDLMEIQEVDKNPGGERLTQLCERVIGLVERGNETVRNMNRFAHSVDDPVKQVDLGELLGLMVSLSAYMPYARKVVLDLPDGDTPLVTRPFLLLNLIYECLAATFQGLDMQAEVTIRLCGQSQGAALTLSPGPKALSDEVRRRMDEVALGLSATLETASDKVHIGLAPCRE